MACGLWSQCNTECGTQCTIYLKLVQIQPIQKLHGKPWHKNDNTNKDSQFWSAQRRSKIEMEILERPAGVRNITSMHLLYASSLTLWREQSTSALGQTGIPMEIPYRHTNFKLANYWWQCYITTYRMKKAKGFWMVLIWLPVSQHYTTFSIVHYWSASILIWQVFTQQKHSMKIYLTITQQLYIYISMFVQSSCHRE